MRTFVNGVEVTPTVEIYPDDTIDVVQSKLGGHVYLYAQQRRRLTTREIYAMFDHPIVPKSLVQTVFYNLDLILDKPEYTYTDIVELGLDPTVFDRTVSRSRLRAMLESLHVRRTLEKSEYSYDDLLDLNLDNEYDVYVALGQKMPPGVTVDPGRYVASKASATPEVKRVLLEYFPIHANRIFGITADRLPSSRAYLTRPPTKFVDLSSVRPDAMPMKIQFTHVKCVVNSLANRPIPLEQVFRQLHASAYLPLMRYNAVEPIYRAYAPSTDADGNLLPVDLRGSIKRLVGKHNDKSLTIAFNHDLALAFHPDGLLEVEWSGTQSPESLNHLLKRFVNPVIQLVNQTLQYGTPLQSDVDGLQRAQELEIDTLAGGEPFYLSFDLFQCKLVNSTVVLHVDEFVRDTHIPDQSPLLYAFADDDAGLRYRRVSNFSLSDTIQRLVAEYRTEAMPSLVRLGLTETEAREAIASDTTHAARLHGMPIHVHQTTTGTQFTIHNVDHVAYISEILKYLTAYVQGVEEAIYESAGEEVHSESGEELVGGGDQNRTLRHVFFPVSRMQARDPEMYAANGNTAKQCLTNKFPITLKPSEYEAMQADSTNPDPFNLVMDEEGVVLNKPLLHRGNYYVCPRYWDMSHPVEGIRAVGAPMSEKAFKRDPSNLDRQIDKNDIKSGYAREGKDIYEFLEYHANTKRKKYRLVSDPDYELDPTYAWAIPTVNPVTDKPCCGLKSTTKDRVQKGTTVTAQTGTLKPLGRGALTTSIIRFLGPGNWFRVGVAAHSSPFLASLAKTLNKSVDVLIARLVEKSKTLYLYQNGNLEKHFATNLAIETLRGSPVENFRSYLRLADGVDYTFLWDIICRPGNLKKSGLNLCILRDSNGSVEIVCPTNHFNSEPYVASRPTLLFLQHDNIFEPIWMDTAREFTGLAQIQRAMQSCSPDIDRMPLKKVLAILTVSNFRVRAQLTHMGKSVGLRVARRSGESGIHVPCYPSAKDPELREEDVYTAPKHRARDTAAALHDIAQLGVICLPVAYVAKDGKCVAIVTQTQQLVLTKASTPPDLPASDMNADAEYASYDGIDPDRVRITTKRMLEIQLYTACRNTLRLALIQDRTTRTKLVKELHGRLRSDRIRTLVQRLLETRVEWVDEMPNELMNRPQYMPKLILFKRNLVTGSASSYIDRLVDELRRFQHHRAFLLNQQTFYQRIPYDINENEMLLIESQWPISKPIILPRQSFVSQLYDTVQNINAVKQRRLEVRSVGLIKL